MGSGRLSRMRRLGIAMRIVVEREGSKHAARVLGRVVGWVEAQHSVWDRHAAYRAETHQRRFSTVGFGARRCDQTVTPRDAPQPTLQRRVFRDDALELGKAGATIGAGLERAADVVDIGGFAPGERRPDGGKTDAEAGA